MDKSQLLSQYNQIKAEGLKLDMSRGKPPAEVLAYSNRLLEISLFDDYHSVNRIDCRNYGVLDGIPEAKALFAPILGVSTDEIIIGGNSSLQMMYDAVTRAMLSGVSEKAEPWSKDKSGRVKFICPVPGYDRHFSICEGLGIEMLNLPLNQGQPDIDMVEDMVARDGSIKGMWCVTVYSNPTGITYSDQTVRRLAGMKTKADDFRLFWDCAYIVHHLTDTHCNILNILDECKQAGNPDRVYMFGSTSKITFPGAGVAIMAASEGNTAYIKKHMGFQTIGSDKLNQLRHVRFFKDFNGIVAHMKLLKDILKPKFDAVIEMLEKQLKPHNLGEWHSPDGGYFISFDGNKGTAEKTVRLCKEAGVVLTNAGATFPYGKDPEDRNIRIAPSFPPLDELKKAMEIFCLSVKLANLEVT